MNELLKFTIIITTIVLTAFVLLQCIHTLSNNTKVLAQIVEFLSKGGKHDK